MLPTIVVLWCVPDTTLPPSYTVPISTVLCTALYEPLKLNNIHILTLCLSSRSRSWWMATTCTTTNTAINISLVWMALYYSLIQCVLHLYYCPLQYGNHRAPCAIVQCKCTRQLTQSHSPAPPCPLPLSLSLSLSLSTLLWNFALLEVGTTNHIENCAFLRTNLLSQGILPVDETVHCSALKFRCTALWPWPYLQIGKVWPILYVALG